MDRHQVSYMVMPYVQLPPVNEPPFPANMFNAFGEYKPIS